MSCVLSPDRVFINRLIAACFITGCVYSGSQANATVPADEPAVELLSPASEAVVTESRIVVRGRVTGDGLPIIVVRPIGEDLPPWFIQAPVVEVEGGVFEGEAQLGSGEVGAFEIRAFLCDKKCAVERYPVGERMSDLPDAPLSEPTVVLRGVGKSWLQRYRVQFSGGTWLIKSGVHGPGPNSFASKNVRLDNEGLHLMIKRRGGLWTCAEVIADEPVGYGEYRWVISGDFNRLDPNVVMGLFLYADEHREIDFELSRWGNASRQRNAQFCIQPLSMLRMQRFDTGRASQITVSLDWRPTRLLCRCWNGADTKAEPLAEWTYSGDGIPKGRLRTHMNFWLVSGSAPTTGKSHRVTIESFAFSAATQRD